MARHLASHLRKPVHTVITGLDGSGKSTLLNMFLGDAIVSHSGPVPVIEIAQGAANTVTFEGSDGTQTRLDGLLSEHDMPAGTTRIRQELASPELSQQSFAEVRIDVDAPKAALSWISQNANIVLWCTEGFNEDEQQFWKSLPDGLKDHGFLVLTKTDRHLADGTLEEIKSTLEPIVSEEFLGLLTVAAPQGLMPQPKTDSALWASSGGKALVEAVSGLIEKGRAEDLDQAQMLIESFAPDIADEKPDTPADDRQSNPGVVVPMTKKVTSTARGDKTLVSAVAIIDEGAEALVSAASRDSMDVDKTITICADTMTRLVDHFATSKTDDHRVQKAREDAHDGQEMILLFQLEKNEDAATDAVTVLLQLKTEFLENSFYLQAS